MRTHKFESSSHIVSSVPQPRLSLEGGGDMIFSQEVDVKLLSAHQQQRDKVSEGGEDHKEVESLSEMK